MSEAIRPSDTITVAQSAFKDLVDTMNVGSPDLVALGISLQLQQYDLLIELAKKKGLKPTDSDTILLSYISERSALKALDLMIRLQMKGYSNSKTKLAPHVTNVIKEYRSVYKDTKITPDEDLAAVNFMVEVVTQKTTKKHEVKLANA